MANVGSADTSGAPGAQTTSTGAPPRRRRRWLRRLLLAAVATPALIALVGFLVAPPLVRRVAERQLGELLGRRVTVERVRLNPFSLSLAVEGLRVFEPDGVTPFFAFGRLYVNVEAASIWRRGPVVRELRLESPSLRVVRTRASGADPLAGYNFSDIVARLTAAPKEAPPPPPPGAPAPPPRFSVNNIRLSGGEVTFEDQPLASTHRISELDIGVPFVSTLPLFVDTFVEPGLRVRVDGAAFVLGGRTKPFKDSLETTLELRVADLDLTRFVPYVPVPLRFEVASARLNVSLDLSFVRPSAGAPSLGLKGRVALDDLDARHPNRAPLLRLAELEVLVREADVTGQRFALDKVAVRGLEVHAQRRADGSLDLQRLVGGHEAPPARKPPSDAAAPATPARFEVGQVEIAQAAFHLQDRSVQPPVAFTLAPIDLVVRDLSNAPGSHARVTLALRAVPGGTIKHEGTLSLEPLVAEGSLSVDGIEPARFAPYYRDQIAFDVREGRLRVGTGYRFEAGKGEPKVVLRDAYLELAELALHRRTAAPKDDFFRLGAFAVRGATVDLSKHTVAVAQISSRDGKLAVQRAANGVIDLATLVPPGPPAPPATPATPAPAGAAG
jgi:hypothetical protein